MVESDSSVSVKLINEGCDALHPFGWLVDHIREWKDRNWEFQCVHVCREANCVADELANMAHDLDFGLHVLDSPLPQVSNLLLFYVTGVTFPRSTCV